MRGRIGIVVSVAFGIATLVKLYFGGAFGESSQFTAEALNYPSSYEVSKSSVPREFSRAGVKAYNSKDYVTAVGFLQYAVDKDPDDELAHQYLALAHERLEQFPQAKKEFAWIAEHDSSKRQRETARMSAKRLDFLQGPLRPRIVLFTSNQCHFSKEFEPIFERVKKDHQDKLDFVSINLDKPGRDEMYASYGHFIYNEAGQMGVPSFVCEDKDGVALGAICGAIDEQSLRGIIAKLETIKYPPSTE